MEKILGAVAAVLVVIVAAVYFLSRSEPEAEDSSSADIESVRRDLPVLERREIPAPPPEVVQSYALSGALPELGDSDESLFNHLRLLITPIRLQLLKDDQFIRKFVLQIDNAANGELIYLHSPIVAPEKNISIIPAKDGGLQIDPESYDRYDQYADLAGAVDTSLLVAYYQFYEPLLEEAHQELGYDEGLFRSKLIAAIDQALAAPVVQGSVGVNQPEINYLFSDSALEALNPLQKQFLRMGPENTQKIQLALQQFKARIQ